LSQRSSMEQIPISGMCEGIAPWLHAMTYFKSIGHHGENFGSNGFVLT